MYINAHIHGSAAEWFATGITLHELLTGRRPFEASRLQAFRHRTHFPECGQDYHPPYLFDKALCADISTTSTKEGRERGASESSDALWPEHLQQCAYLSAECKDFVRALLVPDVSYAHYTRYLFSCIYSFLMLQAAALSIGRRTQRSEWPAGNEAAPLDARLQLGLSRARHSSAQVWPASLHLDDRVPLRRSSCAIPCTTAASNADRRTSAVEAISCAVIRGQGVAVPCLQLQHAPTTARRGRKGSSTWGSTCHRGRATAC